MIDMLAMLKRIQNGTEYMCPDCGAVLPEDDGHDDGCELKAAIDQLEAKEAPEDLVSMIEDAMMINGVMAPMNAEDKIAKIAWDYIRGKEAKE